LDTAKNGSENFMPMLFVGHGNPMNAIEDNEFSQHWRRVGKELPKPKAILCISAHWETQGTYVTAMEQPKTIHDFYGFPPELFNVQYPAHGQPQLAAEMQTTLKQKSVVLDHQWGLDHGCWSVLVHMYPHADIPVVQLSLDHTKSAQWHFDFGKELAQFRSKGVLILGSGNLVHNLQLVDWKNPDGGYPWAEEARTIFNEYILNNNVQALINYPALRRSAALAIPTPEHFLPLLYILGAKQANEPVRLFNDKLVMGSLSMTSLYVG
jgi:4,5-DOPA dioxygenase extradiol